MLRKQSSISLRQKSNFFSQIKLIWAVQSPLQKYFCFPESKSRLYPSPSRPTEGRCATSRNAGRDAVDAGSAGDERRESGRQSRVVLTPRRWRQVCGSNSADDGGQRARAPGRARYKL